MYTNYEIEFGTGTRLTTNQLSECQARRWGEAQSLELGLLGIRVIRTIQVGDFVKPANPDHPQHSRIMRIISERDGFFCASPLSNHPEWSISMAATGFVIVDPPAGWENFKPVSQT